MTARRAYDPRCAWLTLTRSRLRRGAVRPWRATPGVQVGFGLTWDRLGGGARAPPRELPLTRRYQHPDLDQRGHSGESMTSNRDDCSTPGAAVSSKLPHGEDAEADALRPRQLLAVGRTVESEDGKSWGLRRALLGHVRPYGVLRLGVDLSALCRAVHDADRVGAAW